MSSDPEDIQQRVFPWRPFSQVTYGVTGNYVGGLLEAAHREGLEELPVVLRSIDLRDDFVDSWVINKYRPFGLIGRHRDYKGVPRQSVHNASALALRGSGTLSIYDARGRERYPINPGDLFITYNRGRSHLQRREHAVRAGIQGRLSIGN